MRMSHVNHRLRAVGLGLVFACIGFSLALATSGDAGSRGTGSAGREISSNCTRRPTTFVTAPDLGLVVVGTQFTRQILVQFGFKPHLFFFGDPQPSSSFTISDTGTISGVKTDPAPEAFEVRVVDQITKDLLPPVTRTFVITGVDSAQSPALALQFVNPSSLLDAVANEPYTFTIHANGGQPPYSFEFASDDDLLALPTGLALNTDTGELFGKPVLPTPGVPASFTIICRDAVRTEIRRTFTLVVLPGTISSSFVATSGNFKLNFGTQGAGDRVKLTVLLDKTELARNNIRHTSDLLGQSVAIDFGGVSIPPKMTQIDSTGTPTTATFPNTFDKNGTVKFPDVLNNLLPLKGNNTTFQISLNAVSGVMKISASNINMIKSLGANFRTFKDPVIPLNIRIGATSTGSSTTTTTTTTTSINYDKTDVVKFRYRRSGNSGNGSAQANTKVPPGGLFLISKVSGSEVITGPTTDRVILKFKGIMRGVGGAPIAFKAGDTVEVNLGTACMGEFPATSLKTSGDTLTFRNDDLNFGLANFVIDNKKGTIYFDTHPFLPRAVFGQDILNGGEPLVVPITVTISSVGTTTPSFDGQSSVAIFRRGSHLQNK